MRALSSDIVHETYYCGLRTAPFRTKVVLTVYDMIDERYSQDLGRAHKTCRDKAEALRRADHVICISESTRNDLLQRYALQLNRVSVIHLAGDMPPVSKAACHRSEPYILYVGSRWTYKNFGRLVEAIGISKLCRNFKLVCFGGGPLNREEMDGFARHGIPAERVDQVSGDNALLAWYYVNASLFVYPSLYEGFGIPLLEAMQCGCPVACSNTSSFPEVAGDAAEYFDPDDAESIAAALLAVLDSGDRSSALISKGRVRAHLFSWDQCARETYDCYRVVMNS
jgi:glycosyltransferase involved in cell wall biosynthesis